MSGSDSPPSRVCLEKTPPGHGKCQACLDYYRGISRGEKLRRPADSARPDGDWGYCALCRFLVPVESDRLVRHDRSNGTYSTRPCSGGGALPYDQPGPEAP